MHQTTVRDHTVGECRLPTTALEVFRDRVDHREHLRHPHLRSEAKIIEANVSQTPMPPAKPITWTFNETRRRCVASAPIGKDLRTALVRPAMNRAANAQIATSTDHRAIVKGPFLPLTPWRHCAGCADEWLAKVRAAR